jgi:lipid-A-disaccharide synthase
LPDVSFAVLGGPNVSDVLSGILARSSEQLEVLENVRPTELARASKLCLTKSGTITLEVASQGTPMVIFYRASPLVAFLAYGLSETPYIGLVNILAGRVICPERATSGDCGGWIAEQALRLLQDADAYEGCRQAIRRTLSGFAQPGASARAARSALSLV